MKSLLRNLICRRWVWKESPVVSVDQAGSLDSRGVCAICWKGSGCGVRDRGEPRLCDMEKQQRNENTKSFADRCREVIGLPSGRVGHPCDSVAEEAQRLAPHFFVLTPDNNMTDTAPTLRYCGTHAWLIEGYQSPPSRDANLTEAVSQLTSESSEAKDVILDPVLALQSHPAARTTPLRTENGPLGGDIATFYPRLSSNLEHSKHVDPLLQLVVTQNSRVTYASNIDI